MIKKADIVLFFAILIIGLAISYFSLTGNQEGDNVVITVDGQMYATYPLDEDREIEVAQNGHINKRRCRFNGLFRLRQSGLRQHSPNIPNQGFNSMSS